MPCEIGWTGYLTSSDSLLNFVVVLSCIFYKMCYMYSDYIKHTISLYSLQPTDIQ